MAFIYFKQCYDENPFDPASDIQKLIKMVKEYGGWPLMHKDWFEYSGGLEAISGN
jgi:hypothetical protein